MRGIIIEKKWHSAIVMTHNGQFRRLYFPIGREVADEVTLGRQPSLPFAVAAMALIFLVVGLVGWNTRFQPAAYGFVSIEVNPAAEFHINKYGVVVEGTPLNGEAWEILTEISYRWRSIERVASDYVTQALAAGFIDHPEEARILVTISGIEGADSDRLARRLASIETAQKERLEQMAMTAETDYRQVTPTVRQEAASLGVATGTWERIQQGEEIPYTYFDLEIESGDDELEVTYHQKTHSFEAEVEWESGDTDWELEGSRALEYLLPILRRLKLTPEMSREMIVQQVVTAFEWPSPVDEFSLTAQLTDGRRISFEMSSAPQEHLPADDNQITEAFPDQTPSTPPSTDPSTPEIVFFDLEIEGNDDDELEVEYEKRPGESATAEVEFEQKDRTIVDLDDQAAVNYLMPRFSQMDLRPGMDH